MSERCPFCGYDPYHYVDNGVGMEAVAITCCELGMALYSREKKETVTISFKDFSEIADKLYAVRELNAAIEHAQDMLQRKPRP